MTGTLETALLWARRGWPVIPLHGKAPAIPGRTAIVNGVEQVVEGGKGYADATTDPETIRAMWGGGLGDTRPITGIGSIVQPGFVILDLEPTVDPASGLNGIAQARSRFRGLSDPMGAESFRVRTARNGFHVWWRAEQVAPVDRLGTKIELLQPGRWCVLPGSKIRLADGRVGEYRVLPGAESPGPMPEDWRAMVASLGDELAVARVERARVREEATRRVGVELDSIAAWKSDRLTWDELLPEWGFVPAGRAAWRHPSDPHGTSAAVGRDGRVRVFSTTAAGAVGAEQGQGYSKFQVWARVRFGGDGSAAAREARAERELLEPRRSRRIG